MKRIILCVWSLTLVGFLSPVLFAQEWKEAKKGHFVLKWQVDGANLNVKLSAKTTGWMSVGFKPTSVMKDANIIIGYVENGKVQISDHFGNGRFSHRSDKSLGGQNNITGVSGNEKNGITTINFTIPLNSGDKYDRPLKKGERFKVIFASSKRDGFNSMHNRDGSKTIIL